MDVLLGLLLQLGLFLLRQGFLAYVLRLKLLHTSVDNLEALKSPVPLEDVHDCSCCIYSKEFTKILVEWKVYLLAIQEIENFFVLLLH